MRPPHRRTNSPRDSLAENPVHPNTSTRFWDKAREKALSKEQYASPLARRPYDLRHACVSLWLNSGVPATQVAECAGHSVNVLLKVYASCIDGQDEAAKRRIELTLAAEPGDSGPSDGPNRDGMAA